MASAAVPPPPPPPAGAPQLKGPSRIRQRIAATIESHQSPENINLPLNTVEPALVWRDSQVPTISDQLMNSSLTELFRGPRNCQQYVC